MARGIQWSNINQAAKPNDSFTFLYCIIMMFIDSVIYMLLTIYIENVFPGKKTIRHINEFCFIIKYLGEYGIPQVWYYPFTKAYWFGFDAEKIRQRTEEIKYQTNQNQTGEFLFVY
jgi:hypothetical protein